MALDLRDLIKNKIFFEGVWEPILSEYVINNISSADVFYDIGANVGYFSILAAKANAKVLAFEPDPVNVERIWYHQKINQLDKLEVNHMGIGEENKNLQFYRASILNNGQSGFINRNAVESMSVAVFTLDYLIYDQNFPKPNFLKIDTEGWELKVLKGATKLLTLDPPKTIIFEWDGIGENSENVDSISQFLSQFNYQITQILNDDHGHNHVAKLIE